MASLVKATDNDLQLLSEIGKKTLLQSHGKSATPADLTAYVNIKFSLDAITEELRDKKSIFHIIYHVEEPAGYSKMIFSAADPNLRLQNATKLERLYLLEKFYGLKLGLELFKVNLEISKENQEAGMWLFVWKENYRAINFYRKLGFEIVGSYDFKISDTHSNPNHQMYLKY